MVRAARSLDVALGQLNALAPNRNKASDGGIASSAHSKANPTSDHEADRNGVYHARDFTHDPTHGADMNKYPMALIADPRAKYVIWDDQFYDKVNGRIRVRPYKIVNPERTNKHDKHLHLSVEDGELGESGQQWGAFIGGTGGVPTPPPPPPTGNPWDILPTLSTGMNNPSVGSLQRFMVSHFPAYNRYTPNNNYGPATTAGIKEFQRRVGITGSDANGTIVGPRTKRELWRYGWRG